MYNLKRKQQKLRMTSSCSSISLSQCNTQDMLYVVMEQCKCTEKNDKFIWDVTCAPERMAVLCSEQQMRDFVAIPSNFAFLG